MTRTLPENTVDAWTAIDLARQGATWIWLPTTNQGGTKDGIHPGDISAVIGRRLIILESKGIEKNSVIHFGKDHANQHSYLERIEDVGCGLLGVDRRPPMGWVFYNLPTEPYASGAMWRKSPKHQWLACPHNIARIKSHLGMKSVNSISLDVLRQQMEESKSRYFDLASDHYVDLAPDQSGMPPWQSFFVWILTLDTLKVAVSKGLVGLPLEGEDGARIVLSGLIDALRGDDPSDRDDRDVGLLLQELAEVARRGDSHLILVVL